MKKIFIILWAILIPGCFNQQVRIPDPGFQYYRLTIEQDGFVRDISDHVVMLEKKPFTLILQFTGNANIFLNASATPESYRAASGNLPIEEIEGFRETEVTEELFNRDESLTLSRHAPHYWHYVNESEHRFSEVIQRPGVTICRRRISWVQNMEADRERIPVSRLKENELYLVLMKMEWNTDYSRRIEKKRDYLRIIFRPAASSEKKNTIRGLDDNFNG